MNPIPFAFRHDSWKSVPAVDVGERLQVNRVRTASGEAWWIQAEAGARVSSPGLRGESLITVCSGRLTCLVLGNEVAVPTGDFVLIPPQLPFELRVGGRSPASAMLVTGTTLDSGIPLDPA